MRVKLEDIREGMELQSEESSSYLHFKTGEIINLSNEALIIAEDEEEYDHLPDWQQEEVKTAIKIVENFEEYTLLPSQFDINEYDMMQRFCLSLSDIKVKEKLHQAIKGKGAFRRFKDVLYLLGLEKQWYEYRDNSYKEIAREFCKSKNIDYLE